jgi:hypothetical protein
VPLPVPVESTNGLQRPLECLVNGLFGLSRRAEQFVGFFQELRRKLINDDKERVPVPLQVVPDELRVATVLCRTAGRVIDREQRHTGAWIGRIEDLLAEGHTPFADGYTGSGCEAPDLRSSLATEGAVTPLLGHQWKLAVTGTVGAETAWAIRLFR